MHDGELSNDLVVCREVSKVVGPAPGLAILADVDLAFPRGCLFAITGSSGSGKSTLLNVLTGIDRPSSGDVLFDGRSIVTGSENTLARWRGRHVGIVFQFFHLVETLTAFENVLLALELGRGNGLPRGRWRARARECLDAVGLAELGDRMPSRLSGGEQQRVAIARALANDPPLVVADEPTGNLDSTTAEGVFELIEQLAASGRTVVFVTHDRDWASRAQCSIELRDGRVVARRELVSR